MAKFLNDATAESKDGRFLMEEVESVHEQGNIFSSSCQFGKIMKFHYSSRVMR